MKLRGYQQDAVTLALRTLRNSVYNGCLEEPTGAGKSVIIAHLTKELLKENPKVRVLILAHVKELVKQNHNKLSDIIDEDIGIFSAGLNRKDTSESVVFGTIASVWNDVKKGIDESTLGHFDLIIIDEAHRINTESEGMYHSLVKLYQEKCHTKVLGFTATPYRTATGTIIGDKNILNFICHQTKITDLIKQGYISKPVIIHAKNHIKTGKISIKKGDFDSKEVNEEMKSLRQNAMAEILDKTKECKHLLCFCCNIEHAERVNLQLNSCGISSRVLHSKIEEDRDEIIADYKKGKFKCLVNVNMLTEGFDYPDIDCIILMRPTMSPGLYVQMIGRGFRITPSKMKFVVLDFGENIKRHGCIDDVRTIPFKVKKSGNAPVKACPKCGTATHVKTLKCPECGYAYTISVFDKTTDEASDYAILSADNEPRVLEVKSVTYRIHVKVGSPKSIKVTYSTGMTGFNLYDEYVCLYHEGFAAQRANEWWYDRTVEDVPEEIEEAMVLCKSFEKPKTITVKRDGKYWRIIDHEFENKASENKLYQDKTEDDLEEDVPM